MKNQKIFLIVTCFAFLVKADWFDRILDGGEPLDGRRTTLNLRAIEVDTSSWFTENSGVRLDFDYIVSLSNTSFSWYGFRGETNIHNGFFPEDSLVVFYNFYDTSSPDSTSSVLMSFSASSWPSMYGTSYRDFTNGKGEVNIAGNGNAFSLPLVLKRASLGESDTLTNAWYNMLYTEPLDVFALPGERDTSITAYVHRIVTFDQEGIFTSNRPDYESLPYSRWKVQMRVDSVVTWLRDLNGQIVAQKNDSTSPAFQEYSNRYHGTQYYYYNPDVGIFSVLHKWKNTPDFDWAMRFFFLERNSVSIFSPFAKSVPYYNELDKTYDLRGRKLGEKALGKGRYLPKVTIKNNQGNLKF